MAAELTLEDEQTVGTDKDLGLYPHSPVMLLVGLSSRDRSGMCFS